MIGDALQAYKNINKWTWMRESGGNSSETSIGGGNKTSKPKSVIFLDETQKLAKDVFVIADHAIIERFLDPKMPPHLR